MTKAKESDCPYSSQCKLSMMEPACMLVKINKFKHIEATKEEIDMLVLECIEELWHTQSGF